MTIRIGASEIGGTFYTQALALKKCFASVPSLPNVEVVESHLGASIENAHRLESGDLDFAFISAPWVAAAKRGTTPFSRSLDLKTVAPMNIGPNFFIVRADSPLTKVADLRGRKLAIGLRTSGMTPHADAVLNALRMGPHDLERVYVDFAEGAEMLVAGDVDAQYQRPIPNRVMTDLCQRVPLRILRFDSDEINAAWHAIPYDRPVLMRKGAIPGLIEDIPQLGVVNLLVAHARCSDDLVSTIAQTIIDNAVALGTLNPLFAGLHDLISMSASELFALLQFDDVTLHPGAVRAYANANGLEAT